MYVTLNSDEKEVATKSEKKPRDKNTAPRNKKEYCVYSFENIENTLLTCSALRESGYKNESSLYSDKGEGTSGRYFLVLQEEVLQYPQGRKKRNVSKSDLANEYGKKMSSKEWLLYIKEHGDVIVEKNAVEIMGVLG